MEVQCRTAELLQRDHGLVVLLLIVHDDLLVAAFTDDQASVTPAEVIHTPEGIDREEETVHRISGEAGQLKMPHRTKMSEHTRGYRRSSTQPT